MALGVIGVTCFSGTAPATRVAVPVFGATTLTMGRILIAAVLGSLVLAVSGRFRWPGVRLIPSLVVMGMGLAVGYPLFLALAVQQVPAYHGAVVIGLVPAVTAVLAFLSTKERPPVRFWVGTAAGFTAVVGFALLQSGGRIVAADGWLVASIVSCAIGYVEGAKVARNIGATATVCWAMILLAPLAVVVVVTTGSHQINPPFSAVVGFAYAGVASMFLGSLAWYSALAAGGTARIGQLNLGQPFLAIIWSSVLLDEELSWWVPLTALVVLACMILCIRKPDQHTGS